MSRVRVISVRASFALVLGVAAPAGAQSARATIAATHNEVELSTPARHDAAVGEALEPGQRVRTGEGATADIAVDGSETRFSLGENTSVVMFAPATRPPPNVPPSEDTTLVRGQVRVRVPDGAPRHVALAAPGAVVTVARGESLVTVDARRVTRVAVYRGRAVVRAGVRGIAVGAGYRLSVDAAGRPIGRPSQLPAAPAWVAPPPVRTLAPGAVADVRGTFGTTRGRPTPARWHLQLARDAAFGDLVLDARRPGADARLDARSLAGGEYFARVSAVDGDGFEGAFSPVASFVVAAPRVAAGGSGRRASVQLPVGFYCGIDGAPLSAAVGPVALAPGRTHRVRCAPTADGSGATEVAVTAAESGPLLRRVRAVSPGAASVGGMTALVIELADGAGVPVPYANITARGSASVNVADVREGDRRGTYTTTVTWPRGAREVRVHFVVNGVEEFDWDMGSETAQSAPRR